MTMLRVHDLQQNLVNDFVKQAKLTLQQKNNDVQKENVFRKGQEMGFCNDEIRVLLEDVEDMLDKD